MGEFGILDALMLYFGWSILVFRKVYLVFGMVCLLFRSGIFYIWYFVLICIAYSLTSPAIIHLFMMNTSFAEERTETPTQRSKCI